MKPASLKTASLALIRRGPRKVLWTPPNVRLGNLLYLWLHAAVRQANGEQVLVLESDRMAEWRSAFPLLFDELVVARDQVKITDQRLVVGPVNSFDHDFSRGELKAFTNRYLLARNSALSNSIESVKQPTDLTINIRRGDYFSVPRWRGEYSFDTVEYVRETINAIEDSAPINSITIVSDDLDWCRIKLHWLNNIAPTETAPQGASVLNQLAMLAISPRLVVTNSTFGYWGAYLNGILRTSGPTSGNIWAPAFHSRPFNGKPSPQLDPEWFIVQSIPGGWDG